MKDVALLAVAMLALAVGCKPQPTMPSRNVLLITLDTTRFDRLGCYGSTAVETPSLDGIASGGTVFERAFAVAPITATSHAAILSGTYPPFSQVRDNDVYPVPRELPWLPTILQQRGFNTAGIVAAFPLRSGAGFGRGFDYFSDTLEAPAESLVVTNLQTVGVPSRPGERVSAEFELWLKARKDRRPFFAWLHYYDPHWPYTPGGGYAELYANQPYDGEIAYMDNCIGRALRALREQGLADSTGLVVVADHGESLGDHGELTHALQLYNSTLHVPLIVRLPWLESQRPRVERPVSIADVMPTIVDALGIDPAGSCPPGQGRSLLSTLEPGSRPEDSPPDDRLLYFETFYPYHHYRWSPLSGFVKGNRKFIHGPFDELFDIDTDMAEARPIAKGPELAADASQLAALTVELRRGRPATSRHILDREEVAQLEALGYAADGVGVDAEAVEDLSALPHPHARMAQFARYNDITALLQQHRVPEALEIARSIASTDPKQKEARLMVATFNARLNHVESADEAFTELLKDFSDKDVLLQAGTYFLNRRDFEKARHCFERLVADSPDDAESLTLLARTMAEAADLVEARQLFERSLAVDPSYREALIGLAVLLDRQGSPDARQHFETAASKYPFDPQVNFDYAIFLLRQGREPEALQRLRRAADLASGPLFVTAQMALATCYERRGELDQARACLREVVVRTSSPNVLRQAQTRLAALEQR